MATREPQPDAPPAGDARDAAERLAEADPADVDPAALAAMVAAADERELREVVRGDVRRALLDGVFARIPEFVDPDRAAGVEIVVEWRFTADDDGIERHVMALEDGVCRVDDGISAAADVVLELDAVDFLALVTGNADPGVLLLGGALEVGGDARAAAELLRCFAIPTASPGQGGAAEQPPAIDPVAVARAVGRASDRELHARLRGEVRELVLDEVFARFGDYLNPERAAGVREALQWQVTGREDGGFDRYVVLIEDGVCRAGRDLEADPRVSLRLDGVTFLKLVTGNANPILTFMRGGLSVRGDLAFAARLPSLFRIPSP